MENRQQELLDALEQDILIVAGSLRVQRMRSAHPAGTLAEDEDRLAAMLEYVLELKQLLGVPSSLTRERRDG